MCFVVRGSAAFYKSKHEHSELNEAPLAGHGSDVDHLYRRMIAKDLQQQCGTNGELDKINHEASPGKNSVIGERGLLTNQKRSCHVIAGENGATISVLTKNNFPKVVKLYPGIVESVRKQALDTQRDRDELWSALQRTYTPRGIGAR